MGEYYGKWEKAWMLIDEIIEMENINNVGLCIYLIAYEPMDRYKIGISNDPYRRLRETQAFSPVELKLIDHVFHPCAPILERALHGIFLEARIHSEWFELSDIVIGMLRKRFEVMRQQRFADLSTDK